VVVLPVVRLVKMMSTPDDIHPTDMSLQRVKRNADMAKQQAVRESTPVLPTSRSSAPSTMTQPLQAPSPAPAPASAVPLPAGAATTSPSISGMFYGSDTAAAADVSNNKLDSSNAISTMMNMQKVCVSSGLLVEGPCVAKD